MPIPLDDSAKEEVIAALVANVEAMIKADRKIPALKQLQVSRNNLSRKYLSVVEQVLTSSFVRVIYG